MTVTAPALSADLDELPGGPYDIEFFFDPGCPFAWQTSVWVRRVVELRDVKVGWRFISLRFINEGNDVSAPMLEAQNRGLRYHRICAAARERFGNDAVGALYQAYGERYWYAEIDGEFADKMQQAAANVDPAKILADLGLPEDLLAEADNDGWDVLIRAESDAAFERTGNGVGTPIITYVDSGNSLFGPVISEPPADDETTVALYDALRTLTDYPSFSELKRSKRPPLNLPLFN
jgi:2-hydroxychromene-2-carboxylate isomerase